MKKSLEDKPCRFCEKPFTPRFDHAVYCSTGCRKEWHMKREPKRRTYLRILERDFFRCIYCGKSSFEDGAKLTLDHIYPHTRGGEDIASNLVTSCVDCNSRKNDRKFKSGILTRINLIVEMRNLECGIAPQSPVEYMARCGKGSGKD